MKENQAKEEEAKKEKVWRYESSCSDEAEDCGRKQKNKRAHFYSRAQPRGGSEREEEEHEEEASFFFSRFLLLHPVVRRLLLLHQRPRRPKNSRGEREVCGGIFFSSDEEIRLYG